ncbi:MAG TPA: ABC transporter ATP-binding protein [Gemmatimonadales bacterium]|nr:ABC transporter ATP-binding protein [Gemmatimonadales bacterium]
MTAFLELDGLTRRFGGTVAVDVVSLAIGRGEVLALLGPSGSGKTTTLRLLAGFEIPDAGRVVVDGLDVTRAPPVARRFGMVFQHYALFPHLDVRGNVAFGLESLGVAAPELDRRVAAALELVDLGGFERRRIAQLSGGQQQRVALARALAPEPRVLLLDEPLSNLDPALRERTRRELHDLIRRIGITTVLVTHEQEEAFDLGDRVAVLRSGRLEQVGTPDDLYRAPANPFVAGFVGRASSIEAVVVALLEGGTRVRVEGVEWGVPADAGVQRGLTVGQRVRALLRPEAVWMARPEPGTLRAVVEARRFAGATSLFVVRTDLGTVLEVSGPSRAIAVGERVGLVPSRRAGGGIHLFPWEAGG